MLAVFCDCCNRVVRSDETLRLSFIDSPRGRIYGGNLCKECLPHYETFPDPYYWGTAAKPKTNNTNKGN